MQLILPQHSEEQPPPLRKSKSIAWILGGFHSNKSKRTLKRSQSLLPMDVAQLSERPAEVPALVNLRMSLSKAKEAHDDGDTETEPPSVDTTGPQSTPHRVKMSGPSPCVPLAAKQGASATQQQASSRMVDVKAGAGSSPPDASADEGSGSGSTSAKKENKRFGLLAKEKGRLSSRPAPEQLVPSAQQAEVDGGVTSAFSTTDMIDVPHKTPPKDYSAADGKQQITDAAMPLAGAHAPAPDGAVPAGSLEQSLRGAVNANAVGSTPGESSSPLPTLAFPAAPQPGEALDAIGAVHSPALSGMRLVDLVEYKKEGYFSDAEFTTIKQQLVRAIRWFG